MLRGLLPADDTSSTVYDLSDSASARPLFETRGWSIRLFKVRDAATQP